MSNDERTNVEKATAAWADDCPSWVLVLAQECDATSQRIVGERLGFTSGSVVSTALANKYSGDMELLQKRVEGEFMAATVRCPVNDDIPLAACLEHQAHAKNKNRTNSHRVRMESACRKCSISRIGG